jgi:hypothetical protein
MSAATLFSNAALAEALANDPQYKALVLEFQKKALEALDSTYEVKSLGATLTVREVAEEYAKNLAFSKSWYQKDLKDTRTQAIITETRDILKGIGLKTDAESLKSLIVGE